MLEQTLTNVIVCLMISQKLHTKLQKRAIMLQWILGRFFFFTKLTSNETSKEIELIEHL